METRDGLGVSIGIDFVNIITTGWKDGGTIMNGASMAVLDILGCIFGGTHGQHGTRRHHKIDNRRSRGNISGV